MAEALLIDDDASFQAALAELVRAEGFSVDTAASLGEARAFLGEHTPDLALVDLKLPDGSGLELLREIDSSVPTEIVLITGHATVDSAVEALRSGASDYLTKPVDIPRLKSVLANVVRRRELREEIESLRGTLRSLGHFGPLIGASPAMQAVYDMIARVAPTDATVLVQGESGTGKELVAQTLHQLSRRRKEPFVALNCAAVSPQLIESELFGHERGSFTGAARTHKGYFERAEGGTLFLDEISEMPIELQVRLLRELKNALHRAFILADEEIEPGHIPLLRAQLPNGSEPEAPVAGGMVQLRVGCPLAEAERRLILATLHEQGGNKEKTAKTLGISLKTLYNKLNKYKAISTV